MNETWFERAKLRMPGGVNSPVRAFGSVGLTPRFMERGEGAYLWDVEGNRYLDYVSSWGPLILGHNHPVVKHAVKEAVEKGLSFGTATKIEVEMAEFLCQRVPNLEMVRMVNSGTEAVMSAIRAARGFTGRDKIIKFAGCYHGHSDGMLVQAGSGVMTTGIPGSAGVPQSYTKHTLTAIYNDLSSVRELFVQYPDEIAAIIVEPVAANMGVIPPKKEFLEGLRTFATAYGAVLIFDEVITGFRLAFGGAQEYFGVDADLMTYGKIIGGGMPVGAYGGKREIMEMISPSGPVYQAGTLSGNPVAMAAGLAQLSYLYENRDLYQTLNQNGEAFYGEMKEIFSEMGAQVHWVGSLGCVFFTDKAVENEETAKTSQTEEFAKYYRFMMEKGVYLAPSQFETIFLSLVHEEQMRRDTLDWMREYVEKRKGELFE